MTDDIVLQDTDIRIANIERLVLRCQQETPMRHAPERGWYIFDGKRWRNDHPQAVRIAIETAQPVFDEIKDAPNHKQAELFKWARMGQSADRIKAMLFLAESKLSIPYSEFDAAKYLRNLDNGTLDLKTGKLRDHFSRDFLD